MICFVKEQDLLIGFKIFCVLSLKQYFVPVGVYVTIFAFFRKKFLLDVRLCAPTSSLWSICSSLIKKFAVLWNEIVDI